MVFLLRGDVSFFMSSAVDAFFDVNSVAERIAFIAYI